MSPLAIDMADIKDFSFNVEGETPVNYDKSFYDLDFSPAITDARELERYRQALVRTCDLYGSEMSELAFRGDPQAAKKFDVKDRPASVRIDGLKMYLEKAALVLWKSELWTIATNGAEAFTDQIVEPSLVNPIVQLWVPDRALFIKPDVCEILGTQGRTELWAVLIIEDQAALAFNKLVIVPFFVFRMDLVENRAAMKADPLMAIPYFRLMTTKIGEIAEFRWQLDILAMLNFLKLSVTEVVQVKTDRAERRRAEKAARKRGYEIKHPEIYVVQLRKVYRAALTDENGVASPEREYGCHWLVGAHWRNQWYPSTQTNHPKFIAPYIKGDTDKPFKAPSKTIYNVVR